MRYSAAVSALALATAALAQDPITIHVGNDGNGNKGLLFTPNSVKAPNGTVVTFVFDTPGTNHTIAQSAFAKPCEPLLPSGFDSGYTRGPANAGDPPATWNLTITNDAKPIWFYCAQTATTPAHCTAGMVGAINAPEPPAANTFDAFVALAKMQTTVSQPAPALSGLGAFATASPTIFVSANATASATASGASSVDSSAAASSGSGSTASATDSAASSSTDAPQTTQAQETTTPTATATNTDGGAVTTMTVSSSASSSSSASTSNAAVAGSVGTNGLVWAVAAVFGVALL